MKMETIKLAVLSFSLCLNLSLSNIAQASNYSLEEVAISYGRGIDVTQWVQVDFIQHVTPPLRILEEFLHEPYLDIGISQSHWAQSSDLGYHISANLMVRTQEVPSPFGSFFLEAGFGPHLFSRPGRTNRLDTAFEFNSFVGLGLHINPRWSLVAKARHLSNAGITDSNAGVNLYLLELHYRFKQP